MSEEDSRNETSFVEDSTLLNYLLEGKESLNDSDGLFCWQYVEKLSAFGLSKLSGEPEHLKEEQKYILHQTRTLAFENYQTFIEAAECSKQVYADFNIVEDSVNSMIESLPLFSSKVEEFAKSSQEINACRKQNSVVLSRHTQLLEILEISQLMDTCVRNGYYEEALELSSFVKRLEKKFSSIKIINDIGREVSCSTQYMLNQLLQQLKGSVQLPACLRIISYIRQLDAFSEAELRITFLQARDTWFTSVLEQTPTSDAYIHLTKVIEASRVNLFDIITQYKAIFSDEQQSYSVGSVQRTGYTNILHSWVIRKISEFVKTLHEDVNKGLGGRLDSVFGQCMYFGLSFSRIGADFRGIVISIFHKYALKQFKTTLQKARYKFEDDLSTFKITEKIANRKRTVEKNTLNSDPCTPPHELLDFPPLGFYLNGILMAFNDLRQYPALSLVYKVREIMTVSLEKVLSILENWARLESQSQPARTCDDVKDLCLIVCKYFLPHIKQIFEMFYNSNTLNDMIGRMPIDTLDHVKNTCYLNVTVLQNFLKDFVDLNELYNEMNPGREITKSADSAVTNVDPDHTEPTTASRDDIQVGSSLDDNAVNNNDSLNEFEKENEPILHVGDT